MPVTRSTLEWYDLLARGLLWAAGIVLFLSLIGAVVIAGSDTAVPLLEEAERQGRGILALAALGGGLTSAGILGGLGAILRMLVVDRLIRLGDEAQRDQPDPSSPPAPPPAAPPKPKPKAKPKPKRREPRAKQSDQEAKGEERAEA